LGRWTAERWAASSGIGFAILLVVSSFLAGTPPHYNASSSTIASFLTDHHHALVIQGILSGVLLMLWIWFLASYAGMYRDGGQGRLSTIMYGAGVVAIGLMAIGDCMMLALTQLHVAIGQSLTAALYGVSVFMYLKLFWALAALAFASWLANMRSHVMPEWFGWLSCLGGICFVIAGLSIRSTGFFSPAGAMVWIAFIVFAAWAVLASWLCMQKHAVGHAVHHPAMSH
jgi:hypothetical protein